MRLNAAGPVGLACAAALAAYGFSPRSSSAEQAMLRGEVEVNGDCTVVGVAAGNMRELCGGSGLFRSNLGTAPSGYQGEVVVSRTTRRGRGQGRLIVRFGGGTLVLRLLGTYTEGVAAAPNRSSGAWRVTRATGNFARTTGAGTYAMVARIVATPEPPVVLLDPKYAGLLRPRYAYRFEGRIR